MALSKLNEIINEVIGLVGMKVSTTPDAQAAHAQQIIELVAFLIAEYGTTPGNEIRLAYRLAVKGELRQPGKSDVVLEVMAELNPRSFGRVFAAYTEFKRATLTRNPIAEPKPVLALPPPKDEVDKGWRLLLGLAFQAIGEGGTYNDLGNAIYDWLDSRKAIPFNNVRRWEFMKQAQLVLLAEVKADSEARRSDAQPKLMADAIKRAIEAGELYGPAKPRLISIAKRIAFSALVKEQTEIGITCAEFLANLDQPADEPALAPELLPTLALAE